MNASVAPSQAGDELHCPGQRLALLLLPALLIGIRSHVGDLVVVHRDRHQDDIVDDAPSVGIDHVGEEAHPGLPQLAGPRPAALDVPLQGEPFLEEVVDVLAKDELVRLVVLELSADEEDAGSPEQRSDEEEVHVDAAGRVVGRQLVLEEHVLKHEVVEVRLV